MPCDRHLLEEFWGEMAPLVGDPQNFGMVCFTEAPPAEAKAVRKKGDHFLAMKGAWARANKVRKVRYYNHRNTQSIRQRAKVGLDEMKAAIRSPDDMGLKIAYRNKGFASFLGAPTHSAILEEYEYSQTWRDAEQREWRITQSLPMEGLRPRELPSAVGWGQLRYLRFTVNDVAFLGCPAGSEQALRDTLPGPYKDLPIHGIGAPRGIAALIRALVVILRWR